VNEIQSPTTIREQIQFNCSNYRDRSWLISPETSHSVSFREVEETVLKIGQTLLEAGIKPGSSIAIASPNSTASCLMFMAIVSAGFVAVPLNLVAGTSILAYTIDHAEVQLIFVGDWISITWKFPSKNPQKPPLTLVYFLLSFLQL